MAGGPLDRRDGESDGDLGRRLQAQLPPPAARRTMVLLWALAALVVLAASFAMYGWRLGVSLSVLAVLFTAARAAFFRWIE